MVLSRNIASSVIEWNNSSVRANAPWATNPLALDSCRWHQNLVDSFSTIRSEWTEFAESGGMLPRIEDVLGEHQGNSGVWRIGLLLFNGQATEAGRAFPLTQAALRAVGPIRFAMWSLFEPGVVLPKHSGPNVGVLRYHLGIDCGEGATLAIGDVKLSYRDGEGILFDDTVPHSAANDADRGRVTLFCEVEAPLTGVARLRNRLVQEALTISPGYRSIPVRALDWHRLLNESDPAGTAISD